MKILYVAVDQAVPGTLGGATHVRAVADGLSALGHEVHALVTPGRSAFPVGAVHWHALRPPLGARQLRLLRARRVRALARALRPDVVIERFYNFGGEGMLAGRAVGALTMLEINAPAVDHPGSMKRRLDRVFLISPMRRWREWQCAVADLVVTPHAGIVPAVVPRDRLLELEWGADTTTFRPGAFGPIPFTRRADEVVVVFAGAFRSWHGAVHLVDAIQRLRQHRGRTEFRAVLIGDGPELARARAAARGAEGLLFTGALAHEALPAALAACDVGAAPFDVVAHRPLALGFYWSPLKVFEYMAAGLPVVLPTIDRLATIVRPGREGMTYDPSEPEGLADALDALRDSDTRAALGAAARERVTRRFSWERHCRSLADAMEAALDRRVTR